MSAKKLHLADIQFPLVHFHATYCNRIFRHSEHVTKDISEVDCRACRKEHARLKIKANA